MSYKRQSPLPLVEGGTGNTSLGGNEVLLGDGTSPLQSVSGAGIAFQALASQGAGMPPIWADLTGETFFEPLASDPVSPTISQVWYNTTSQEFKGCIAGGGGGTWVNKTAMPYSPNVAPAGAGTGASGLLFGGGGPTVPTTSLYDGGTDGWTSKSNMTFARQYHSGAGDPSDALAYGGVSGTLPSNRYNGGSNSWSNVQRLISQTTIQAGCGSATDALVFGGVLTASATVTNRTERFNGTLWVAKSGMNVSRQSPQGAGNAGDALCQGGLFFVTIATAERYNGSLDLWSNIATASVVRFGAGGAGTMGGDSMVFGGADNTGPYQTSTELYSGVSNTWSTIATMNVPRYYMAGQGTTTDALGTGGINSLMSTANERFQGASGPVVVVFDLTPA